MSKAIVFDDDRKYPEERSEGNIRSSINSVTKKVGKVSKYPLHMLDTISALGNNKRNNTERIEESAENFSQVQKMEQQFLEIKKGIEEAAINLIQDKSYKNENIALLLGKTKAGKSTLVNVLLNNQLKAVYEGVGVQKSIKLAPADSTSGPTIGLKLEAETTIPTRWHSDLIKDITICDVPGWNDNRGITQDSINAFNIYEIINQVKSLTSSPR